MKRGRIGSAVVLFLALGIWLGMEKTSGNWTGVDESVVGSFATRAGRPPRAPFIDTATGDLPLLAFLLAGTGGGFVAGYTYRGLFPGKGGASKK